MTRPLDNPIIIGLPDLCADAFALILRLRAGAPSESFAAFRAAVAEVLRQLERRAAEAGVGKSDLDDAMFAVVATIDELVQTSDWAHRDAWIGDPLAVERFDEPNAGEVFYDRLQGIARSNSTRRRELLEVYATCIHLGFRGIHASGSGREELRGILADTVRQATDPSRSTALSKTPRPAESVQQRIKRAPVWAWVALGLVACVLFSLLLRWHAERSHADVVVDVRGLTKGN